ncbi:MAG: hypothetical protein AAFR17_11020 [Pseudomonadota bacterium]
MKTGTPLLAMAATLAALVILLTGPAPFGRVLLSVGLPGPALLLLDAPIERGHAFFRAGRYGEAEAIYRAEGDLYHQGLAAAWGGDFAAALAAWDARLTAAPADRDARANYDLIASVFAGTELDATGPIPRKTKDGPELAAEMGQGGARAAGAGDETTNKAPSLGMAELSASGLRRVPKVFDAQYLSASERWLTTLSDEPGLYLAARIAAEAKARRAAGLAPPLPEDPE